MTAPLKVVHCKREPFDVYIGRANGDLPQSKWANPFVIGQHGTRDEVIAKYEAWVRTQPELMAALPELRGKTLGCWCAPFHNCHAYALDRLLQEVDNEPHMSVLPIFSSHYSYGSSILTLEEAGKTTAGNPVSICDIAKSNSLKQVVLVEDHIDGFIEAYKNLNKVGAQLVYGVKLCVCDDMSVKDEASLRNESNVVIFIRNSQGYNDLIKLWNRAWTDGFYYQGRIDWKTIKQFWTPNLAMAIPFFSGFIARNTLTLASIVPDFPVPTKELFLLHEVGSGLPFVSLIEEGVNQFVANSGAHIQDVKSIYYEKASDFPAYVTFRAIHNRAQFSAPRVDHLCSDKFSWEAYKELTK